MNARRLSIPRSRVASAALVLIALPVVVIAAAVAMYAALSVATDSPFFVQFFLAPVVVALVGREVVKRNASWSTPGAVALCLIAAGLTALLELVLVVALFAAACGDNGC